MRKEKQIEEMAKDLGIAFQLAGTTRFGAVAEVLVNAGYRKQSEGEWLPDMEWFDEQEGISAKAGFYQTGWKCSLCGRNEYEKEPYCNCGAKMKGQ